MIPRIDPCPFCKHGIMQNANLNKQCTKLICRACGAHTRKDNVVWPSKKRNR